MVLRHFLCFLSSCHRSVLLLPRYPSLVYRTCVTVPEGGYSWWWLCSIAHGGGTNPTQLETQPARVPNRSPCLMELGVDTSLLLLPLYSEQSKSSVCVTDSLHAYTLRLVQHLKTTHFTSPILCYDYSMALVSIL